MSSHYLNDITAPIDVHLVLSSDHFTGATGKGASLLSLLVIKRPGSANFVAATGTVTEALSSAVGTGHYSYLPLIAEVNVQGQLVLMAHGVTGCDDYDCTCDLLIVPATAAAIAIAVWNSVIETGVSAVGVMRHIIAQIAGPTAGPVSGSAGLFTAHNPANTKTRISTVQDANGYRAVAATLDET